MTGSGPGNVISGNALAGVQIFGPTGSLPADHNLVVGNLIGTNPMGSAPLGNRGDFRRLLAELFDRGFPADPFAP